MGSDIADGLNEIESKAIEYSQHNNSLVEMLEIEVRDIGSECRLVGTEEDTASPARSPESAAIPPAEIKPETIASIIFTSGTAYDPKGVKKTKKTMNKQNKRRRKKTKNTK